MEEVRLQKFLADSGIDSRRKCEDYIQQGRVKVNGVLITKLGKKINPEKDKVLFDNKEVRPKKDNIYILLNKPIGYVCTLKEQFNRDKVTDLVKVNKRVVPVRKIRYVYIWCFNFDKRWRFCL